MAMTEEQALDLVRRLLKAKDEKELSELVSAHLSMIDGTFFGVLEASAQQLEREGKAHIAKALRGLGDRMLRMKLYI